ncbi:AmmeMemoRadiSam system radical SAM enzyme [candidate division KSB1 bacterium]|nr:AmmeMemoRadiSam system radical SAM enzyme [candidate division KSB1 bacterium]
MDLLHKKRLAALYEKTNDGRIVCKLCPRGCMLKDGQRGFCGTRQNINGELYTLVYGKAVRVAQEFMETEGVFHFAPGAPILSIGNMGCNMHCKFCQNWETSQMKYINVNDFEYFSPEQIVELAINKNIKVLSWTYNDPVVWHEFVMDTARLAREKGLLNLYKSAFYLTLDAVKELCEVIDIFSISLKSIREDFYTKHASATLPPILEDIRYVYKTGIHLELSNLMVTGLNDTEEDARAVVKWHLENTSDDVPLHFVRFHPAYHYKDVPRTPVENLVRAREIALEMGVKYCYIGNVYDNDGGNTFCPECHNLLIKRYDINTEIPGVTDDGKCKNCGYQTNIKVKPFKNVMVHVDTDEFKHQSKEVYRWSEEINRLHIEVTNFEDADSEVSIFRLGDREKTDVRNTKILPRETYRFIVSKSKPDETGIVICYPPALKIRISELLDRAHLPTTWKSQKKKFDINDVPLGDKVKNLLSFESGIRSVVTRNVLFPSYLKLKGQPILKYLNELEKSQYFNPNQVDELQLRKLKLLLEQCAANVPYYLKLFQDNGFDVKNVNQISDLFRLPILEKATIRDEQDTIQSQRKDIPFYRQKTSGSIGLPLEFLNDYQSISYSIAARFRAVKWWGLGYGMREAHFWGRHMTNSTNLSLKLSDYFIRNKIILTTFDLSEEKMFDHYKRLLRFKPHIIYGNPSAIYIFARFVVEQNLDMTALKPKAIISTTELLHEYQREFIEKVFGCPTINEYGSAEIGIIAYECPEHNMHLAVDNSIIEIVKDGQHCEPGEFGEIIITNLHNRIMPFIRYRLGDVARFVDGQCDCGVKLPMLDLTIGRDCDTIILEDRELPGAVLFGTLGKELNSSLNGCLDSFKIYQKDLYHFQFKVVLRKQGFEQQLEQKARDVAVNLLGPKITLDFDYVDHIPREPSGKLRYFVSEIFDKQ